MADRVQSALSGMDTRLDDRWIGTGATGERFSEPAHPYAEDLDLFGRGSLFELLSTARTHVGEETLAEWLRTPASIDVIPLPRLVETRTSEGFLLGAQTVIYVPGGNAEQAYDADDANPRNAGAPAAE